MTTKRAIDCLACQWERVMRTASAPVPGALVPPVQSLCSVHTILERHLAGTNFTALRLLRSKRLEGKY